MSASVLVARGITKKFPGVVALREVSFDLRAGEIHALCGENGAGKSTLIKLLSGLHPHGSYEGELEVGGRPAHFRGIADAGRAGLAVIYQELALVEEFTVAENIFLGAEPTRGPWIDWPRVRREARELLAKFGVDLDPELPCSRLGVGQKQLVEIVKALRKDSRILILDEPTAALAEHEMRVLLGILRDLRGRGIACIYISHKLDEVFAIADRITVLRDGASIVTLDTAKITAGEIIRHMVGRELAELFPRRTSQSGPSIDDLACGGQTVVDEKFASGEIPADLHEALQSSPSESSAGDAQGSRGSQSSGKGSAGEGHPAARLDPGAVGGAPALRVTGLTVADPHTGADFLRDISFSLAPGEVLGIGGLMGAGRTELLMHLFGAWGLRRAGRVELHGAALPPLPPAEMLRRGLALVSEDRRRYGLVLAQSVGFNLSLSSLRTMTRGGFIDTAREFQRNDALFRSLRVKAPGLGAPVGKLSGGNQQKVVLGKALMTEPQVILLDEPTRGIDVGAKIEIYEIIHQLADAGKAVVFVSSELPELIGMSDRILMLHEGRIAGEFQRAEATQEELMQAAMGHSSAPGA